MGRFEEYFLALRGKKILVMGLGVSNRPLVRLLLEFGCTVTGCDRTPREKLDGEVLALEKLGCTLSVGEGYLEGLSADVVFRTPGMHPDHPAFAGLRAGGARVTSEMEAFFALCPCPIIGVTGSDGKTTTTSLIAAMLRTAGKKVWLGGNIGTPLLPQVRQMTENDLAVVELSSFQLLDMTHSPQVALITNLTPNHLDVHKDMAEYTYAKETIFRFQKAADKLILNADDPATSHYAGPGRTVRFSRKGEARCCLKGEDIYLDGRPVLSRQDILLPGDHNVENYMAAILAVEGLVTPAHIRQTARSFGGVAHRTELVRTVKGVRYYNDSIASTPTRTAAGLKCFPEKVILIAGGYDKHIPYDAFGPEVCKHVKALVLCGATAPAIRASVEGCSGEKPPIYDCANLDEAITRAVSLAKEGDVVLLSPASASFDQFKNFEERGNFFKSRIGDL